jgi:hypothetical protein
MTGLFQGPRADMTPPEEALANRNIVLAASIVGIVLDECPDPADVMVVLTLVVGQTLQGFETEAQRLAVMDKLRIGALEFTKRFGR